MGQGSDRESRNHGSALEGTGDPRSSQPTIAIGVLVKVLLVILFSIEEFGVFGDFSGDGRQTTVGKSALERGPRRLRCFLLRGVCPVDGRAVLSPDVIPLPHSFRWVVSFPKGFQQFFEGASRRVEPNCNQFGVSRKTRAILFI